MVHDFAFNGRGGRGAREKCLPKVDGRGTLTYPRHANEDRAVSTEGGVNGDSEVGDTVGDNGSRSQAKKKGNRNYAIPLCFLVAGAGFEPATFGL